LYPVSIYRARRWATRPFRAFGRIGGALLLGFGQGCGGDQETLAFVAFVRAAESQDQKDSRAEYWHIFMH